MVLITYKKPCSLEDLDVHTWACARINGSNKDRKLHPKCPKKYFSMFS